MGPLVLIWISALFLGGWPSKIEVIGALGNIDMILTEFAHIFLAYTRFRVVRYEIATGYQVLVAMMYSQSVLISNKISRSSSLW